jgi:hypothetical protein
MNLITRFSLLLVLLLALAGCSSSTPTAQFPTDVIQVTKEGFSEELIQSNSNTDDLEGDSSLSPSKSVRLSQDYENAVNIQMQLLVGTLKLEGTSLAVTADQATELLPLWQMIRSLTGNGTAAQAEIDAVLSQIQETMSTEQIQAIQDMQISSEDYQAQMEALGFSVGINAQNPGTGSGQPGQGANMTAEERATRQAEMGVTGNAAGGKNALLDRLIEVLQSKHQ